ncbi:hypothetical protein [Ancylobacter sp. G4_0304]|uniref:hypothetical protein n=1 Tax=Ancylobacter sp. G4_0304 TaxID=3114289 RepID=UPI0039C6EEA6
MAADPGRRSRALNDAGRLAQDGAWQRTMSLHSTAPAQSLFLGGAASGGSAGNHLALEILANHTVAPDA